MRSRRLRSSTFKGILIGAVLIIGLGILSISSAVNTNVVKAEETSEATQDQPPATPFANFLTKVAAPTATKDLTAVATVTSSPTATDVSDNSPALRPSDAMATITSQQEQIKALQDQLAATQGDHGATLYAVVIIVIGLLLAFAVFFGLRRG